MNGQKKQTFIIKNYGIASFITTMKPTGKNKEDILEKQNQTTIFITEGDSASGSITKSRRVDTQAVFSLRGKPLNCFGLTKKVVYENEEFNLLQHALNIEDGYEGLAL